MPRRAFYFEIFAVSLAAILLEIAYTRIFSFKVYYYFTYLIIGLALLGLGTGGVLVAISRVLRRADPAVVICRLCFVGGASVPVSYFGIATTQLNAAALTYQLIEVPKLFGVCLLLTIPFLAAGIIISTILSVRPQAANRLYGADLVGAALGCIICIPLLERLEPPRTVFLAGLIFTIAGFPLARRSRVLLGVGGAIGLALLLPLGVNGLLPDPVVDVAKKYEEFREAKIVRFSRWHPVFRVDVSEHPLQPGRLWMLHHDGQPGSGLRRFDGDFSAFQYLHTDERALPFQVLAPQPRVLVIGAAGGHEVLASLFFGAKHVTAVELNPVTLSLLTDRYADVTGRLHENPRVTLVNGEGRWFMKQSQRKYDLIWFVAPDSYAAMNASTSGAFVLSESYLYTVEMLSESLKHLTERGIICAQFGELDYAQKPNRTTRYVATARQAFEDSGIQPFERHVMVASASGYPPFLESTVLLSKAPFTPDQIAKFRRRTPKLKKGHLRYLPGTPSDGTPVNQVITLAGPELERWYESYRYQVTPVVDDSPFFWHFTRFRHALTSPLNIGGPGLDYEDAIGEQVSFILLVFVMVFAAVFLFLPFVAIRETWREIPHKLSAGAYFASLGLGFMFIEVALIQMLTLFLGYPTHSLSVTLFGLLVFSGIGSLMSGRYAARRKRALGVLMAALIGLIVCYQLGLPLVIDRFVGQPVVLRMALTVAIIAPLGLCLGAFMPLGLTAVAATTSHQREYVAWAWAVNGFFSVMASILSTILAMAMGFKVVLLLALAIYGMGVLSLLRLPQKAAV